MCSPAHRQRGMVTSTVRVAARMVDRPAGTTAAERSNTTQVLREGMEAIRAGDIVAAADWAAA